MIKKINRESVSLFYKNNKSALNILLRSIGIIILFLIVSSMYIHDDVLYVYKNTITSFQTIFSFTDKGKAAVHLKNTQDLYHDFLRIRNKNPKDFRLLLIAHEMGLEEALAMKHMDLAKNQGVDIKDQVKALCDQLDYQQMGLRYIVMIADPSIKNQLQSELNITEQDLLKAMDW